MIIQFGMFLHLGLSLINAPRQDLPSPAALITKMFDTYYYAQTISGKIHYTISAPVGSATLDTDVQIERPGKLYIRQFKPTGDKKVWIVTADGTSVSYGAPRDTPVPDNMRLQEKVGPMYPLKDLRDAYAAASSSIEDRSVPLDVAVGKTTDLDHIRYQFKSLKNEGKTQVDGKTAYVIGGDWKEYGDAPVSGKFQMVVSETGELYRYVVRRVLAVSEAKNVPPQPITQTWDVNLTVNGPVNEDLFTIVK